MARTQQTLSPRDQLQQKFNSSRLNLLLVIILTVVNIVMLIGGSETMMLFSASIPYYAIAFPVILGMPELFVFGVILAVVSLVLYFLCWLLSKKRPGWLVVALVLFALDTLALAGLYLSIEEMSGIVDLAIHVLVLIYLIQGISAWSKLKKMPPEELPAETTGTGEPLPNSTPLRRADEEVKHRVLLEATRGTYRICYRRVKKVNELVINGWVYDEYEALMETHHTLEARIDGHVITASFDNITSRSYIHFDGEEVAKKMRWY